MSEYGTEPVAHIATREGTETWYKVGSAGLKPPPACGITWVLSLHVTVQEFKASSDNKCPVCNLLVQTSKEEFIDSIEEAESLYRRVFFGGE